MGKDRVIRLKSISAIVLLLTLASALLAARDVDAQAEEDGAIFGQIVNRTTGEPVPDIAVTLSTFAEGTLQPNVNTVTDAEGRFEFPAVDSDPAVVYAVSTSYFGIAYSTGRVSFEAGSVGLDIILDVFEPTEDQSLVSVPSRGLILTGVEPTRGDLGLLDIYVLEMTEPLVLIANDQGRTLSFPVPRNASRVTPLPDTSYNLQTAQIEGATIYGTEPLVPGDNSATLSYTIPYTGISVSIELPIAYQTDIFRILLPVSMTDLDQEVEIEAFGFTFSGEEQIGPQTYRVWVREGLNPNDRVQITYSGLVKSEIQPNTLNKVAPAAVASIAGIAALVLVIVIVRGRKLYEDRPVVLEPRLATSLETERSELIDQLQALNEARDSELIGENEYDQYRIQILEQIRIVNRQMRGEGVED